MSYGHEGSPGCNDLRGRASIQMYRKNWTCWKALLTCVCFPPSHRSRCPTASQVLLLCRLLLCWSDRTVWTGRRWRSWGSDSLWLQPSWPSWWRSCISGAEEEPRTVRRSEPDPCGCRLKDINEPSSCSSCNKLYMLLFCSTWTQRGRRWKSKTNSQQLNVFEIYSVFFLFVQLSFYLLLKSWSKS